MKNQLIKYWKFLSLRFPAEAIEEIVHLKQEGKSPGNQLGERFRTRDNHSILITSAKLGVF